MGVRKSINQTDLWEILDHRDNTAWEMIKCYTLSQLSIMDWKDIRAIRKSWNYLPVRIDTWTALYKFKKWECERPYMTFWIRMDEIKDLFKKRNKGKKLTEEKE